jgi:hypothetical protein
MLYMWFVNPDGEEKWMMLNFQTVNQ